MRHSVSPRRMMTDAVHVLQLGLRLGGDVVRPALRRRRRPLRASLGAALPEASGAVCRPPDAAALGCGSRGFAGGRRRFGGGGNRLGRDGRQCLARLALEGHGRAGDHLGAVGVQRIGADDVVADRQLALGLDQEAAARCGLRLAEQDVVGIDADATAGLGSAGNEDLAALDLDGLDRRLRPPARGGFSAPAGLCGLGRRLCDAGASGCCAAAGSAAGSAGLASTLGATFCARRHGDQLAGLARLLDQRKHLPVGGFGDRDHCRLRRGRHHLVLGGRAQDELVVARLQRLVEHDGEIAAVADLGRAQHVAPATISTVDFGAALPATTIEPSGSTRTMSKDGASTWARRRAPARLGFGFGGNGRACRSRRLGCFGQRNAAVGRLGGLADARLLGRPLPDRPAWRQRPCRPRPPPDRDPAHRKHRPWPLPHPPHR